MDGKLALSYEDFQRLAEAVYEKSSKLGDSWKLRSTNSISKSQPQSYLVKRCTQPFKRSEEREERKDDVSEEEDLGSLAGDTSGLMEYADEASLDRSTSESCLVHVEYHVIHSMSYQVPILYFNPTFASGQTLPLEDVWQLLNMDLVSKEADRWGLVTQQEHPYLGQPFYHIHPCNTATVMEKAMKCQDQQAKESNYLITWLSTFAPVVGLEFSIKYAQ